MVTVVWRRRGWGWGGQCEVGMCSRDGCARARARGRGGGGDGEERFGGGWRERGEEIVAPALRLGRVKFGSGLRALTRMCALSTRAAVRDSPRRGRAQRNYFAEIACDPLFVRMELVRLCGKLIGDETSVGAIVAARDALRIELATKLAMCRSRRRHRVR